MALTLDELKKLLDSIDFKYFVDPQRPVLLCSAKGLAGTYRFVMVLDVDGQFLQFRTLDYLHCPADHRNLGVVLRVLGDLNYQLRFVKYGWDTKDGEIVAYGDMWLMDAKLSQQQLQRLLGNYLPSIDMNHPRILQAIEKGQDAGRQTPEDIKVPPGDRGGIRDKIRKLLGGKKPDDIEAL